MKRTFCIILALLLCLTLAACGGSAKSEAPAEAVRNGYGYDRMEETNYAPAVTEAYVAYEGEPDAATSQKLIRRVRLTVETEDYDGFMDGLNAAVAGLGGYFEQIEAYTSGKQPSATLTIRVPAQRLNELLSHVDGSGNVTYRTESQEDVTLEYVDTESRSKALRVEQERLMALLEQAEDLDQILSIEDRLTEVRYRLERTESTLRAMDNLVDYATVTLDLRQVQVLTPVEEPGFWEKIGTGFSDSLSGIGNFFTNLFSNFLIYLPYIVVFLAVPVAIALLALRHERKKRARRQQAAPRQEPKE